MRKKKSKLAEFKMQMASEKVADCERHINVITGKIERISVLKREIEKLNREVHGIEDSWKRKLVEILGHKSVHWQNLVQVEAYNVELKTLDEKKLTTELRYRTSKLTEAQLELKKVREEIAEQQDKQPLPKIPKIRSTTSKVKQRQIGKQKPEAMFVPPWRIAKISSDNFIEVSWDDVFFHNGKISIRHQGFMFSKTLVESREFLNRIKSYYTFKDVPRLQVKVAGGSIKEIANEAVLFFHIKYLSAMGYDFGEIEYIQPSVDGWRKYSKDYYLKNLSFLFHTWSLQKLCQICDDSLPIVPTGEIVINSKGDRTIHNSFIFPIKCGTGHRFIWESVEESKASYVFRAKTPHLLSLQLIYEYVVGEYTNKRDTLIHSPELQKQLSMESRIFHTSQEEWSDQLNYLQHSMSLFD